MSLAVGIHRDVPRAAYLADPCARPSLSASAAHTIVSCSPAHAWARHPRGGGVRSDETSATTNGSLIDGLLLGGRAEIVEVAADNYRTKAAQEARDAALAAGKTPVTTAQLEAALGTADILTSRLRDLGIAFTGDHQLTAVWEEDGVLCRGRLDHWREDLATIYDLKTARNAHPRAVGRSCVEYGYDIQSCAYTRAVEHLRPELAGRVRFVFIFVETEPPYQVLVGHPSGAMRALGEYRWTRAVRTWGECLASGLWPGYSASEVELEPPPWAMAEMEAGLVGGSSGVTF